jgi:dTDP-4-dehydrorhamnose 3,5-epimerase
MIQSEIFDDHRGSFHEWFRSEQLLQLTGLHFQVRQANVSVSHKSTIRGIHYSTSQEGQMKLVTCLAGSILDVVVDIRPNSPTYKTYAYVTLDSRSAKSVLIGKGLGHAFFALEEQTVVSYLLTSPYSKSEEFAISPFDPDLGINWPSTDVILSTKDRFAPELKLLEKNGSLPNM